MIDGEGGGFGGRADADGTATRSAGGRAVVARRRCTYRRNDQLRRFPSISATADAAADQCAVGVVIVDDNRDVAMLAR